MLRRCALASQPCGIEVIRTASWPWGIEVLGIGTGAWMVLGMVVIGIVVIGNSSTGIERRCVSDCCQELTT